MSLQGSLLFVMAELFDKPCEQLNPDWKEERDINGILMLIWEVKKCYRILVKESKFGVNQCLLRLLEQSIIIKHDRW